MQKITKPEYYDTFRCIAGACPDSCCKEWDVDIDEASAARYRALPGTLGERLREVLVTEDGCTVMTIVEGRCPMWRADGLCRIQAELGEDALCRVCREFPRLRHDYGDFQELGLELSCPEAAKLILSGWEAEPLSAEIPGGEMPEYDTDAMAILKATRENALSIIKEAPSPAQALQQLLLYGYQAHGELDGEEIRPFDRETAMETIGEHARPGDREAFLAFFRELEILTPQWKAMLDAPNPRPIGETERALAVYGIHRYWLQAVSDYDLSCRVKFIVIACILVSQLGGDPVRAAQLFSKEIENDADNVDAILDGAYDCPAFTDDKLLGMLGSL